MGEGLQFAAEDLRGNRGIVQARLGVNLLGHSALVQACTQLCAKCAVLERLAANAKPAARGAFVAKAGYGLVDHVSRQ